jgi:hypothetical protein
LIAFVYQKLEDQVAERARTTLEAARAINPNFEVILYMHGIQTGWFYRGLMRGLSTNARPIAVLSYDYFTDGVTTALRQEGISIVSLSGVLAVKLRALDAETALYQAGRSSDGNWMFQFGDFPDVEPGVIGPLRHDPIDAYWSAFGRANARLETME